MKSGEAPANRKEWADDGKFSPSMTTGERTLVSQDLFVLAEQGTGLAKLAGDRKPCPRLMITSHDGAQVMTKVQQNTCTPLWNQVVKLPIQMVPSTIMIQAIHEESDGTHVALGVGEIMVTHEHLDQFSAEWVNLTGTTVEEEKATGKLRIAISFRESAIDLLQKGLAPRERRHRCLAQETWRIVEADIDNFGVQIFTHIFEIDPDLRSLFMDKAVEVPDGEDPILNSPELIAHAARVIRTLGRLVAGFDDIKALKPFMYELGKTHVKWGIKADHLEVFLQALLWTLEEFLGDKLWTTEVAEAWHSMFDTVRNGMLPGLDADPDEPEDDDALLG